MKEKLLNFIKLARIHNALIAFIVVFIGAKAASGYIPYTKAILLGLSMFFLDIFANVQNDIIDIETDRANKKKKPLVDKTIGENEAAIFAFASLLISLILAFIQGLSVFIIVLLLAVLVYLYNTSLKKMVLVSNITVSLILSVVFILSGIITNSFKYSIIPAIIAFYYNFMREIIKDWADIEGDRATGITTIPMVLGDRLTKLLLLLLSVFFILFLFIPFLGGVYGKVFLYISVAFCATPLLASIIILKKEKKQLIFLSKITKILMLPLLLAIYMGV